MKKRFSKISIHSLGFRIFVLLAVMIVFFCALVVYNNTAAFGLMLERIHENSENTLVLYQKSLDENLSRPETYLYVFALNDTDLLSLRAAEPQTTSWYTTLNRIKKSFENAGQPSVFFRWFSSSAHPVKRCPPGGSPLEMATVSFLRNRRNLLDGGFT